VHELVEFFGRCPFGDGALARDALFRVRHIEDVANLGRKLIDDLARRLRRRKNAVPALIFEPGEPGFRDRGHVGKRRRALGCRYA
jgi:hypothetical protein